MSCSSENKSSTGSMTLANMSMPQRKWERDTETETAGEVF